MYRSNTRKFQNIPEPAHFKISQGTVKSEPIIHKGGDLHSGPMGCGYTGGGILYNEAFAGPR